MVKSHDFAGQFDKDLEDIFDDLEAFALPDEDMELLHNFAIEDDDKDSPYRKKTRGKRKLTIPS